MIIPAYNEAKVLHKTMQSVLAPDYPALKVIVVDDGSNDHTVDIIIVSTVVSWIYRIATKGAMWLSDLSLSVILLFILLTFLDVINLVAAFWFERKIEWKLLFLVPFLRFGYRQMLYISSMRSIMRAVSGRLRGWQKLKRTDTAHM